MKYRAVLKGVEAADLPRVRQTFVPTVAAAETWAWDELKPYPRDKWPDARVVVFEQIETLIGEYRNKVVVKEVETV